MEQRMQRSELGVAIVGAGRIGTMRAQLVANHPAVRFLAISDADPAHAHALAGKVGAQLASGDNDEVITHPAVNTVIVATSEHEHTAPVVQALRLGKAVLVEMRTAFCRRLQKAQAACTSATVDVSSAATCLRKSRLRAGALVP